MSEPGWIDAYRPRFTTTMKPILEKFANGQNRSVNNFIVRATLKDIARTEFEKNLDAFIDDLIRNGEKSHLFKCG